MKQKINSEISIEDDLETYNYEFDPSFDLSYNIFVDIFSKQFNNSTKIDINLLTPITFRSKTFQKYIDLFNQHHDNILSTRSILVKELYLLYHFSKSLQMYNDDIIHMQYSHFRSHYYFPNIIYLLIRFLPTARDFFQKSINIAYNTIKKNNSRLVYLYESAVYTDSGVMRTDILYTFLGNTIKKINPLLIENLKAFYRQVFLNHFFYYFKYEQDIHSQVIDSMSNIDNMIENKSVSTRENIYRDVLTSLKVESMQNESPTMKQISYNYNIFKNVITTNEFQNIFLTSQNNNPYNICELKNSQYKILSMYNEIDKSSNLIKELKTIPLVYKLLKSVHLITKNDITTKLKTINIDLLQSAIVEELSYPFKNILKTNSSILPILKKIANNFINSILVGEFINLQTLSPIKIDHISFISQLRKFIQLCLNSNEHNFNFSKSFKLGML